MANETIVGNVTGNMTRQNQTTSLTLNKVANQTSFTEKDVNATMGWSKHMRDQLKVGPNTIVGTVISHDHSNKKCVTGSPIIHVNLAQPEEFGVRITSPVNGSTITDPHPNITVSVWSSDPAAFGVTDPTGICNSSLISSDFND